MEDPDLIKAFLRGETGAFEGLMAKYQRPLFYLVKAMVRDTEDARDITQDAFIKAFNNLNKLKKKERFKTWLFRIGINRARDHLRGKREMKELDESMDSGAPSQETRCIEEDLKGKVRTQVYSLPPRQREVFILRVFQELRFGEIAAVLDMKPQTARAHFHFAMKTVRDQLRKRGVFDEL